MTLWNPELVTSEVESVSWECLYGELERIDKMIGLLCKLEHDIVEIPEALKMLLQLHSEKPIEDYVATFDEQVIIFQQAKQRLFEVIAYKRYLELNRTKDDN